MLFNQEITMELERDVVSSFSDRTVANTCSENLRETYSNCSWFSGFSATYINSARRVASLLSISNVWQSFCDDDVSNEDDDWLADSCAASWEVVPHLDDSF